MHMVPFGCITELGANRAEQVQKFVPRSRVGIFRNETAVPPHRPLNRHFDAFCTIWVHLGPFGLPYELVQKFVPRSRVGIFRNERA